VPPKTMRGRQWPMNLALKVISNFLVLRVTVGVGTVFGVFMTACFVYILWYKAPPPNGAEVLRTFSRSCLHCVRYGTVRCVAYFSKLSFRCIAIRYRCLRSVALPVAGNWALDKVLEIIRFCL